MISGTDVPKPSVDGYIVAIHPNLVRNDGSVPPVDVIHLHHGVWVNMGRGGDLYSNLFFASGEEKTQMILPKGYGYTYKASEPWLINYMLHLPGNEAVQSINPLVAETNDGYLNDIRGRHIGPEDVIGAIHKNHGRPLDHLQH